MGKTKIAITLDREAVERLDRLVSEHIFPNRSQAIDVFNEHSGTVITMAITSKPQRAGFPLTLELKAGNLPKRSWVKISQIRTLSVERIGEKIGGASQEELVQIIEGLNEIIGT